MFRSKRSCLGFTIGAAISTFLMGYGLIYLLTGRFLVPGEHGTRMLSAGEAASELDALVEAHEEEHDAT